MTPTSPSVLFYRYLIRILSTLLILAVSPLAWSISVSPSSPSYTGSYTIIVTSPMGPQLCPNGVPDVCSINWIEESVNNGPWAFVAMPEGINSASFSGKPAGTYAYRVYSDNTSPVKVLEGPITVQVLPPSVPSNPTGPATSTSGNYTIDWGDSTAPGATFTYQLEETIGASVETFPDIGVSEYSFSNKANGIWKYRARACSSVGCSAWTNVKTVTVEAQPADVDSISVTPQTSDDGEHTVTWVFDDSVTHYELEKKLNQGSFEDVLPNPVTKTYVATNLINGDYTYRVKACVSANNCSANWTTLIDPATVQDPATFTIEDVNGAGDNSHANATEGSLVTFTVKKNGATSEQEIIHYKTISRSASSGADYTHKTGTLTFAASQSDAFQQVSVTTLNDTIFEGEETFYLNITEPPVVSTHEGLVPIINGDITFFVPATIETTEITVLDQGIGRIDPDQETAPYFTISNASELEGGDLQFTVTLHGKTAFSHSVDYTTVDNSNGATVADNDYLGKSGTLDFAPNQAASEVTQLITVKTQNETGDSLYEGNETFFVQLSNPTDNATLSTESGQTVDGQAIATIVDDDDIPFFIVLDREFNEDAGIMTVLVQCHKNAVIEQSVAYTITGVSATAGIDYDAVNATPQPQRLYFGNGEAEQIITIPLNTDDIYEGNETFTITLSDPQGGAIIKTGVIPGFEEITETGTATATIIDDLDKPEFVISGDTELEGTAITFTVVREGGSELNHKVDWATEDDTATVVDMDYTSDSGTLDFAPSAGDSPPQFITISTGDDFTIETHETFKVILTDSIDANNAIIIDPDGIGTIQNDDFAPGIPSSLTITPSGTSNENHSVAWGSSTGTVSSYELERDVDGEGFANIYTGLTSPQAFNGLADGTYTYRVRGCNISGCSDWFEINPVIVILPPTDPAGLLTIASNPTSFEPGLTAGEFSVDASGGANYAVPIAVPPGTAGMQPSLSLGYNSRSGNALLGAGWTLGGLSVITRCPQTTAQDNNINGINFDNNDRFCIDGERLIAISGSDGADGTEYRTELDGFTKVVSYDDDPGNNNGPEKFTAWTKSGQILEYGYTADSRIEAEGSSVVRLWAVNQISDTAGNYLTVDYIEDNLTGEYLPDRIDYTGNTVAATSPYASVRFSYETRTDTNTLYLAGSKVESDQRLTDIDTYVGETLVRNYQLTYDYNGIAGASRLVNIQECNGVNDCFPPLEFTWQGDGTVPVFNNLMGSQSGWAGFNFITGDWNGDGRTDIFLQHKDQGESFMYTANADGTMSATDFHPSDWWAGEDSTTTFRYLVAGDWNGDGLTDIARETMTISGQTLDHNVDFYQSNGSSFVSSGPSIGPVNTDTGNPISLVGDWNADGRTDFFVHGTGNDSQMYTANSSGHMTIAGSTYNWDNDDFTLKQGDWNGDGRTDLIRCNINTGAITVYLSNGTSFTASTYSQTGWQDYDLIPADFNGDGYTDLFLDYNKATGTSHLYLSSGDGHFVDSGYSSTDWEGEENTAQAGDWNGDGKADLVRTGGDLYISTGTDLSLVGFSGGFGNTLMTAGDWNGDGLSDLWISTSSVFAHQYKTTHSGFDVVEKITEGKGGLNVETVINYLPLTDASVYSKDTNAIYPEVDLQGAIYVVGSVDTDDGIGGQRETTYNYSGAKVNLEGRGFLGFASMEALDVATNIRTTTTYEQGFPFTGLVADTIQELGSTEIGKVTSTYSTIATHTSGITDVIFPYASSVVKEDREINGTLVTTTTTTHTYGDEGSGHSYGNPLTIKVEVTGGGETYTTFTDNSYTNTDTANAWHLGRLTRAEVTQYLPDNTDAKDGSCTATTPPAVETCGTRVSSFSYDAVTGLLTQEVIEPDTPALRLQTDYLYDDFGNRTDVTVSGGSGATAVTSRTTSTIWSDSSLGGMGQSILITSPYTGRFPVQVTNAATPVGHVERRIYDDTTGNMTHLLGPNELMTQWEYDGFGRQLRENRADGTTTQVDRAWCTASTCPSLGVLKLITTSSGAPASVVISDKLGRDIKSASVGFDRTVIEVDTVYNVLGQVEKTSRPYFAGTTSGNIKWHSVLYDDLGRPRQETAPGTNGRGTGGTIVTDTSYNGLEISVTNDKNQVNKRINNARGELVTSTDADLKETDYVYDPFGNLIEVVVDAASGGEQVSTSNEYDIRGRKTSMDDPDMGQWSYSYNALGELISQTDAKSQTTTMVYDVLGRMVSRIDDDGGPNQATSTWVYDYDAGDTYADGQFNRSIGKLVKVTGGEGDEKTYLYETFGLLDTTTTWIDDDADSIQDEGEVYSISQTYDAFSRVDSITYPAAAPNDLDNPYPFGFSVYHNYTVDGYLKTVRNTDSNDLYWRAEEHTAEGQLKQFMFGNGITTQQTFDANTGLIDKIQSHTQLAGTGVKDVQDFTYDFDSLGNLIHRSQNRWVSGVIDRTYTEDFGYNDNLNRLTSSDYDDGINPVETKTFSYNAIGNLEFKTGMGSYVYGQGHAQCSTVAGPHAVTTANGQQFCYDANGNQTSGYNFTKARNRTLTWTAYNKPREITEDLTTLTFSYGADRARFKQVNNSSNITTYYVGGAYEKQVNTVSGEMTHVHYIRAGGSAIAIYKMKEDATGNLVDPDELRYLHRDHIGSVTEITDDTAQVVERLAYDAWGKRRAPDWTDAINQLSSTETLRGFTGHEMLDDVSLVHMNGRVYDPDLGRFISPDPFVQEPGNAQSFNRYTNVLNNPLSYTDPSGFFFGKILKGFQKLLTAVFSILPAKIRPFVAIATAIALGPAGAKLAAWKIGAISGLIASGGDLKAGIIGAITGNILGSSVNPFLKVAGSAIVGGIGSEIQGGNFLSGFLAGGVSAGIGQTGFFDGAFDPGKLLVSAIAGGLTSKLGGGKFANGAYTGAFAYAVSHGATSFKNRSVKPNLSFGENLEKVSFAWEVYGDDIINDMAEGGMIFRSQIELKVELGPVSGPEGMGKATADFGGEGVIRFNPDAVAPGSFNPKQLAGILGHELVHVYDFVTGAVTFNGGITSFQSQYRSEVNAYNFSIATASKYDSLDFVDQFLTNRNSFIPCAEQMTNCVDAYLQK